MSKLYTSDGWLNYDYIYNIKEVFIFIVGARGIGKTYGAIDYLIKNDIPFMYTRRTKEQVSAASNVLTSDIAKPLNAINYTFKTEHLTKTIDGLYKCENAENAECEALPFCYVTAVSTGSNLRGFNGERIECILYDEFIAQREERPIKEEANAFLNLYETVNRNRELIAKPAVKVIAAANSFNLANPLFIKLGLVEIANKMLINGIEIYRDPVRGVAIIQPINSVISSLKSETALYKLTANTDFANMAINNQYQDDISGNIGGRKLTEYCLITTIAGLGIYKSKSNLHYYITMHITGTCTNNYSDSESDRARYRRAYPQLWRAYMRNKIFFENYTCQVMFEKIYS